MKQTKLIPAIGVAWTILFSLFIVWIYINAPQSIAEVRTSARVTAGTYEINRELFESGRRLFLNEQFAAARDELMRADPAMRDATTQFYIAYSYYREGWGRLYNDDKLFRAGLETVNRALALTPDGTLRVEDTELRIQTAAELKAEFEQGLTRDLSDFNPLRVTRERK
ncbi:MAG: hypothetical protein MSG64_18985 [Pyrinomonadaceae bacterium MAG19_C2-C3]|nr:hypothetical protein [Pyrinomonadaceae bacterium MAG19_C2-C3]